MWCIFLEFIRQIQVNSVVICVCIWICLKQRAVPVQFQLFPCLQINVLRIFYLFSPRDSATDRNFSCEYREGICTYCLVPGELNSIWSCNKDQLICGFPPCFQGKSYRRTCGLLRIRCLSYGPRTGYVVGGFVLREFVAVENS